MFDPSFFELIIICGVALLVLGPERLPGAIKTLGLWIGRLRRSFNNIKREIEQEVGADEIRRQLRNEAIMEKFNNTKSQVTESIESIKNETESIKEDLDLKKELSDIGGDESTDQPASSGSTDPIENITNSGAATASPSSPENQSSNPNIESEPAESTASADKTDPEKS